MFFRLLFETSTQDVTDRSEETSEDSIICLFTQFTSRVEGQADADRVETKSHIDNFMAMLADGHWLRNP